MFYNADKRTQGALLFHFWKLKMRKDFEKFLIAKGYKTETPSGHPSTVYDYLKRIDRVCNEENMSWNGLADDIDAILIAYDVGGIKQHEGERSHRAVINALMRFSEFLKERN